MEIQFANKRQVEIADLLWSAQSMEEVEKIIRIFDHDARVVYNMILAASFDEVSDLTEAQQVLGKF